MKIRNGFVSNSSTTSFLIYGVMLEDLPPVDDPDYEDEPGEFWYNKCEDVGLNFYNYPWVFGGSKWIGMSFANMELDETRRQFQDRVKEKLCQLGIDSSNAGVYKEAWRDG